MGDKTVNTGLALAPGSSDGPPHGLLGTVQQEHGPESLTLVCVRGSDNYAIVRLPWIGNMVGAIRYGMRRSRSHGARRSSRNGHRSACIPDAQCSESA